MESILAEQEELRGHTSNMAQDMQDLHVMLKASQDRAEDFADAMERYHWEEWRDVVLKEARDRAVERRTEMVDRRCRREWEMMMSVEQRKSDAIANRARRNGPIHLR